MTKVAMTTLRMPSIEIHSSATPEALQRDMIAGLRANRLDPKGLYASQRQAELWRQVSLRHSPIHTRRGFGLIYENAFALVAAEFQEARHVELIGLGSGTGEKEAQLCRVLRSQSCEVHFTPIDVSEALVRESAERMAAAGAQIRGCLVCDLSETKFIAAWLDAHAGPAPRLITFFGLVPNFTPGALGSILRELIKPNDTLLASVHLVPPTKENGDAEGMGLVLPQYDNPETRAWLTEGLETWQLGELLEPPEITIGEIEGHPAFIGQARWKSDGAFERWGEVFSGVPSEPLRIFQSLRYTPQSFEKFLGGESLRGNRLALTTCLEEGIWAITPA